MLHQKKQFTKYALFSGLVIALAALFSALVLPGEVQGAAKSTALNELSDAFSRLSEEASPAVVFIEVEKDISGGRMQVPGGGAPFGFPPELFERFFGRPMPRQRGQGGQQPRQRRVPMGQGSGFIMSEDGYIVTNHHVVAEADVITVRLGGGREYEAEVIGSDPQTEIALIKIDATGLPTLPLGNSDALKVGEWVVAIGNPFGLQHTVTAGIVSARGRGNVGITDYSDFIQTDAAINPGNSGGPLLNLEGQVVGLNTAIFSRSGGYMGIGFAIPVNMVEFITRQLIEDGKISRGFLGVVIQNLDAELAPHFGLDEGTGILIAEVQEDSPADKAGLKRDDVVVGFNGQPVKEVQSFRSRIASTQPDSRIGLEIMRDGRKITKQVKIGTLDEEALVASSGPVGTASVNKLGLSVQNITDELAERFGFADEAGVLISQVEPGSSADLAGLEAGMLIQEVNREAVANTNQFKKALQENKGDTVLLLVSDGEYSRYVALETE
jgi:serine protease Do